METTLVPAMVPTISASAMASDTEVATATAAAKAMVTGEALLVERDIPCILLVKLFMCLVKPLN